MPPPSRRFGDYPIKKENETMSKKAFYIGSKQSFLMVKYESQKKIDIYVGGHNKWCINCELIKRGTTIDQLGYLNNIRYDISCSLEHSFLKGKDTKELVYFLVQYIYNTYPTVKELLFSDLSIKNCDNDIYVNLAVMTYMYSEQTWYEKNFKAYIAPQSKDELKRIKTTYEKMYVDERDNKKKNKVDWDTVKETIINEEKITKMSNEEMEQLYNNSETWKEFFEAIYNKIKIDKFCIFISGWQNSFILKYFNNLQGLKYIIPVIDYKLEYVEKEYSRGGRRYTRKNTREQPKDYK
jgi:hypothetical protein